MNKLAMGILYLYLVTGSGYANATLVNINFNGVVRHSTTTQFNVGDHLTWTLSYEVLPTGECPNGTAVSSYINYSCRDIVTSSTATIGSTTFSGPPAHLDTLGYSSFIRAEHHTYSTNTDVFQGVVNFADTNGIQNPILHFDLKSSQNIFSEYPTLPTTWRDSDLLKYNSFRDISLSSLGPNGIEQLLAIDITPVPITQPLLLMGSGLLCLGVFVVFTKRRKVPAYNASTLSIA